MEFPMQLRQAMIDTLQSSLKSIRQALGLGVQQFGDIIGLTRQSVNNLESEKIRMSAMQFLGVCALMDYFTQEQPELLPTLISILNMHDPHHEFMYVEDGSFVKRWLQTFPLISQERSEETDIPENFLEEYKIFLDDTAICEIPLNSSELVEQLYKSEKKVIIPGLVVEVLRTQMQSQDIVQHEYARNGLSNLNKLCEKKLVQLRGEKSDVNLMTTFTSVFIKFKMHYRLALITQNEKLAKAVLSLNDDKELQGFDILAFRFCSDGTLKNWNTILEEQNQLFQMNDESVLYAWANLDDELTESKIPTGWDLI